MGLEEDGSVRARVRQERGSAARVLLLESLEIPMTTMDHSQDQSWREQPRDDPDLAEHVSAYAHFKTLALWGAILLPVLFALVLLVSQ